MDEDGFLLVVLFMLVVLAGGLLSGGALIEQHISQTHCENVGYSYGAFDWDEDQIVCWNEVPAQGLEE